MEEEDLKCSLCLDFFTAPIRMTNCGHDYCQECLAMAAPAGAASWSCPECRTEQQQPPEQLAKNFRLERTVERFKLSRKTICATHSLKKKLRKFSLSRIFI